MLIEDLIHESSFVLNDELLSSYSSYCPDLSVDNWFQESDATTGLKYLTNYNDGLLTTDQSSNYGAYFNGENSNIEKELKEFLSGQLDSLDNEDYMNSLYNLSIEDDYTTPPQETEDQVAPNTLISVPLFTRASAKQFQVYFLEDKNKYQCPYIECSKLYAKPSHLKAHLRRHNGDKPFRCTWAGCSWRFSRSDELARHRRSHSGVKPYQCTECGKSFARSDHLNKHHKVHRRKEMLASSRMKKQISKGRNGLRS